MGAIAFCLPDSAARLAALIDHDHSLLVEAGAGSGKTALMAGRVAMLLTAGVPPRDIVAITFTEAAASELLERIERFAGELLGGTIPRELRNALPAGLSAAQRESIERGAQALDEITCTTIHGFCQQCREPSWRENMELRSKKAIECENIDQNYSHIRWLCSRLELQAAPVGWSVRKPAAARRIDKKVAAVLAVGYGFTSENKLSIAAYIMIFFFSVGYDFRQQDIIKSDDIKSDDISIQRFAGSGIDQVNMLNKVHPGITAASVDLSSPTLAVEGWCANHFPWVLLIIVLAVHALERFSWHVVLDRQFPDWKRAS